jgi:hypothetical protein
VQLPGAPKNPTGKIKKNNNQVNDSIQNVKKAKHKAFIEFKFIEITA